MRPRAFTVACLLVGTLALSPGSVVAGQFSIDAPESLQTIRLGHDLSRLQTWLDASDRHLPGQADAAATLVGSWSIRQLETAFFDLKALLQVVTSPDGGLKLPRAVRAFNRRELFALRDLAALEVKRAGIDPSASRSAADAKRVVNRLVKRGALLHTDIGVLVDAAADKLAGSEPRLVLAPRSTLHLMDAQQVAINHYLFLGVEEQALGRADQARESFERAAALYPRAQSPYLALSQLARRRGDLTGGRHAIEQVFARAGRERFREDPWVTYFAGATMDTEVLLSDIRAVLFLTAGER
jgi:hypothetical protein